MTIVQSLARVCAFMAFIPNITSAISTQEANLTVTNSKDCAPVHMILGRGSTESVPGSLESLVTLITQDFPRANYENIDYPATDETISDSYFIGRVAATKQLISYCKKCPLSKIVLLGYSQVSPPTLNSSGFGLTYIRELCASTMP